ncbi:MAG: TrkA family potassium uptake protein, partial [Methanobrevibacter sp.]
LEETNIEDADFFIATTGNDEANLLSCILVRKYNVPNIIARVSNPDHEEAFKEVGIDNVISPEITAAGFLEKLVTRPNVADLISLGEGDAEILDMTVTNDKVVGKRIKDISPTKDYIIIATYEKDGKLVIPQPDNTLARGEKVSVLVKRGSFSKASKKLEK